ncbi:MAG: cell envelope integrity protein TolA [Pseudomonadota bacterium]|nr:cell envelope integrity protein TolA [Pseudomonadota bacterium]
MGFVRSYSLPLLLALLLHLAVAALLLRGWLSPAKVAVVVKPQVVNASLIVMQERRKPAPVQKPKAKPKAAPKTQNTATKPAVKQQQVRAEAEAAKALAEQKKAEQARAEQQRQQRLAALGELADAALEQSLQRESVSLMRDEEALAAQSFRAGIYELVRKNWSRPPSARNGMSARLLVELIPTGEVISVTVVEGSGNSAFDQSAEQAVRKARRFVVPDENAQFERYFRRFYFLFQPEDLLR